MGKFLSCAQLYEAIQEKSSTVREVLWVCSLQLGFDAHRVFSQAITKKPPPNIRFVFPLNDLTVKRGEINPYEVQFLKEHFKDDSVKTNDRAYANIYIFDDCALLTSAALTGAAFESNPEAGVMVDGEEAEKAKAFFEQHLWQNAKPIGDLKKQKSLWNLNQKLASKTLKGNRKIQPHTKLAEWTDEGVSTWYIGVLNRLSAKAAHAIREETNWSRELLLVGDIGYKAYRDLQLGDLAYLADLNKHRGKVVMQLVRVFDKSRVETDDGDLHLVGKIEKGYTLEREDFYNLLKGLGVNSRLSELKLSDEQLKAMTGVLSAVKPKRKKRKQKKAAKGTDSSENNTITHD